MEVLRTVHAHNKFLVLLLMLATAGALLAARDWGKLQRALYSATHGILGLQVALGLVLVVSLGLDHAYRIEHLATMALAFAAMTVPVKWKREAGPSRARKTGLAVVAALALIVVGVLRLPFPFFPGGGVPAAASAPASAP